MPRAQSARREGHADHKRAVTFHDRSLDQHGKRAMLRSSSARETRQPRDEMSASSPRASPKWSWTTVPSREQRDASFGPPKGHAATAGSQQRQETPKNRNRSTTPSTRDRTPSAAASPVATKSPMHYDSTPRQRNGADYVWFTDDLSHSAARAIERDLSGGRSKAVVTFRSSTPSFSQGPRFAEHLTQEDTTRSTRHIVHKNLRDQSMWEEGGFAGQRVKQQQPRGKRCFNGAPHTADTPGMAKMVCGSEHLAEFWNEVEKENPQMGAMFNGYAGFSDQLADVAGAKVTGTRHFFGAPHAEEASEA